MDTIVFGIASIFSFLFVFTLIVFVHEMGHFLVARWLGFKVDVFSIGFGRPLLQRTDRHGTKWRISSLPLGGYVKFAGDSGATSQPDEETSRQMQENTNNKQTLEAANGVFHLMPVWRRAAVTVSGPLMNFIFAIFVFSIFLSIFGVSQRSAVVGAVVPQSAAERAGFMPGDVIKSANGEELQTFRRFASIVAISANDPIDFVIDRNGEEIRLTATPDAAEREDIFGKMSQTGFLGLGPSDKVYTKKFGPVGAIIEGTTITRQVIGDQIAFVGRLFRGKGSAEMLGGPLRIFYISGKVGTGSSDSKVIDDRNLGQRIISLIWLAGGLSVAIGLINLAPVPMLDGGHLVFYAYEAIFKRPLSMELQIIGYKIGFFAVIGLLAFATFNDLRYFNVFDFLAQMFS